MPLTALTYDPQQGYVGPIFAVYARALREYAESLTEEEPSKADELEVLARDAAASAMNYSKKSLCGYPAATREMARHLAKDGRVEEALDLAQEGSKVADNQGKKYEQALSQLLFGKFGRQLGHPDAEDWITSATAKLKELDHEKELATQESLLQG